MKISVEKIPNSLTIVRMLLIPILFIAILIEGRHCGIFSAMIFLFASITDFLDGYIARKFKVQSRFGKLFDPIADKMLVITAIMMLIAVNKICNITLLAAIIIVCRELFISGVREFLAKSGACLPVNGCGKIKTAIQMISIIFLILSSKNHYEIFVIGSALFWFAAFLSITSSWQYFKKIASY